MTRTFRLACASALVVSVATLPLALNAQPAPVSAPVAAAALEASPQVLAGTRASAITLRLPPGVVPPANARIGIFMAGTQAKLAELSRPFAASPNGQQTTLTLDAEPGLYDIRLLRGDKTRAPLTQSATVSVTGIDRESGWWLFNGSPVLVQNAAPAPGAPLFWPGLKRSMNKSDKSRSANLRTNAPISWRTLSFPPLQEWLRDAVAARAAAQNLLQSTSREGAGFVGCAMFVASPAQLSAADARELNAATPEAIAKAVQAARTACQALSPDAALILSVEPMSPTLAARLIDLAAPECDAVWLSDFDTRDAVSLWPLKAARRVAEEQPEFDLPLFVSPRDEAGAAEAWMSGATGIVQRDDNGSSGPQVLGDLPRALEANLGLFVGSVTLEDSGLLRAGDTLNLFRRMRDIGRVPLLARTYDAAGRRDRSGRDGRRVAEPFAVRWTRGAPPAELLTAIRDAAKDGSRAYFEGSPFSQPTAPGFDEPAWRDLFQANVKMLGEPTPASTFTPSAAPADDYAAQDDAPETLSAASGASGSRSSLLKMDDVWTFGIERGQSVPVRQSVAATPVRTPTAAEAGDAPLPKSQSNSERERIRPAPRVAATLGDGSAGTLISPASGSVRRDQAGDALPRGEVVWTPHLLLSPSAASPQEAARIAAYDASISTLLQPALVRLFDRAAGTGVADSDTLPPARGVRVCVRASAQGTLMVALVNPSDLPRSLTMQTQAAGGYAIDLATNRVFSTRTRALRVLVDVDVPAHGFRLIALAKDAATFVQDRDTRKLKVKAK
jgi:hypothetical protein